MTERSEHLLETLRGGANSEALAHNVALRAVVHLLGTVGGRTVLDLACGEGSLARWLAVHGAHVTGVDSSIEAIESAKHREVQEPRGISYLVGDPEDLYMLDDSSFDSVVCNVSLGRVANLSAVVTEVARVIRLGGRFIFSVGHPCFEHRLLPDAGEMEGDDYFAERVRRGLGGRVRHRTLSTYINAVAARGFTVRRVLEPAAEEHDVSLNPSFDPWRHTPVALVVEAVFPRI